MRFIVNSNVLLWVLQGFLALFFALGSGAPKLLLPVEALPMPITLPDWFVRFIGTAEVLGAIGLILPGLGRVRRLSAEVGLPISPRLTVVAAVGLVLLTICATVYQLLASQPANAVFAAVMSLLCATVALGRGRRRVGLRGPLFQSAAVSAQ
jgi:hypothetical protein